MICRNHLNFKHFNFFSKNQQIKSNNLASSYHTIMEHPAGDSRTKCGQAEKAVQFFHKARTSLDSVFQLFEDHKDEHEDIPTLLNSYKNFRDEYREYPVNDKRFPLIVLEGLDGSGKSTVGMKLTKKLNAERITTPPKSMSSLRQKFDGHFCFHAPFYYFGNYVAALEVSKILKEKPVVMDRFWHSTTAFALAQMKEDYGELVTDKLLEEDSNVYRWPDDLLKPDIVIFLSVCEEVRSQRLSRRTTSTQQEKLLATKTEFRNNVLSAYDNMVDPSIQKVNGNRYFKALLQEIDGKIQHLI